MVDSMEGAEGSLPGTRSLRMASNVVAASGDIEGTSGRSVLAISSSRAVTSPPDAKANARCVHSVAASDPTSEGSAVETRSASSSRDRNAAEIWTFASRFPSGPDGASL
jgi:hypothetical protein